jgi:hypothetical protein
MATSTSTSSIKEHGLASYGDAGRVITPTLPTSTSSGFIDYSQYLNTTPRETSGSGSGTPVEHKMGESTAIPIYGSGTGSSYPTEKESGKRDRDKEKERERERDDGSESEDMDK